MHTAHLHVQNTDTGKVCDERKENREAEISVVENRAFMIRQNKKI